MPYEVTPASRLEKAIAGTLEDPASRAEKALMGQLADPSGRLEALVNARASAGGGVYEVESVVSEEGAITFVFPGVGSLDISNARLYVCRITAGTIPTSKSVAIDGFWRSINPAKGNVFYLQRSGSTTSYGMGIQTSTTVTFSASGSDLSVTVDAGNRLFLGTYKAALIL